jgi:lysophospholipase L1-like esterase
MRKSKGILILIVALIGMQLSSVAQKTNYDTVPNLPEHYVKRVAEFNKQPMVKAKIVMLGNSITEGGNWKKLLGDSSVLNRGISGDVTFGVLNRLEEVLQHKPSKIFLLIGINDLSRNTPDEVIIENLFTIAKRIKTGSPQTELFIQSILPTNESFKNFPAAFHGKGLHITTINTQLARYADKMKYRYIDLYSQFLDSSGSLDAKYATDGLHLSPAGYQNWVRILSSDPKVKLK